MKNNLNTLEIEYMTLLNTKPDQNLEYEPSSLLSNIKKSTNLYCYNNDLLSIVSKSKSIKLTFLGLLNSSKEEKLNICCLLLGISPKSARTYNISITDNLTTLNLILDTSKYNILSELEVKKKYLLQIEKKVIQTTSYYYIVSVLRKESTLTGK
jgi:hypothetical protein